MQRRVLVAGSHGVIGRAAALRLADQPDTEVFGLSRRTAPAIAGVTAVSVDLLDPGQVRERLSAIRDVTHIVFGAYIEKQTAAEKSEFNVAILRTCSIPSKPHRRRCSTSPSIRAARPTVRTSARSRHRPARTIRG